MNRKQEKLWEELEGLLSRFIDGEVTREEAVTWARSIECPNQKSPFETSPAHESVHLALWNGLELHPRTMNEYCFRITDAKHLRCRLDKEWPMLGALDRESALFTVRYDLEALALRLNCRDERFVSPGIGWCSYATVSLGKDRGQVYLEQLLDPRSAGCTDVYTIGVQGDPESTRAQALAALELDPASLLFNG